MQNEAVNVFWFRRDLRLHDNVGLKSALEKGLPVLPVFIFDKDILDELDEDDARLTFIHDTLSEMDDELQKKGSSLYAVHNNVQEAWEKITSEFNVKGVYTNRDYEPYALERDTAIEQFLQGKNIEFHTFKDQVIFEKEDVLKADETPYTVYTPYMKKWFSLLTEEMLQEHVPEGNYIQQQFSFPELNAMGFQQSTIKVKPYTLSELKEYPTLRDIPAADATSQLGVHLRFGTVNVREIMRQLTPADRVFHQELVWREFFMQILYHFPKVVRQNFKSKYDGIQWRNNKEEFEKWCKGETGYPMVDAGMRELNETGYMHNRVRMVVASFLCKHLLIDWRWGEAYFAKKLLDYELSSNNGNWQWSAGTGCDATPYFRVFNPESQLKKFDPKLEYTQRWVADLNELTYPTPMVDHKMARQRALDTYKEGLN